MHMSQGLGGAWEGSNNSGVRHSGSVILLDLPDQTVCLAATEDWCFRARAGRIDHPSDNSSLVSVYVSSFGQVDRQVDETESA